MIQAEKKIKRLEGILHETTNAAQNIDPTAIIQELEVTLTALNPRIILYVNDS